MAASSCATWRLTCEVDSPRRCAAAAIAMAAALRSVNFPFSVARHPLAAFFSQPSCPRSCTVHRLLSPSRSCSCIHRSGLSLEPRSESRPVLGASGRLCRFLSFSPASMHAHCLVSFGIAACCRWAERCIGVHASSKIRVACRAARFRIFSAQKKKKAQQPKPQLACSAVQCMRKTSLLHLVHASMCT